MTDQNPQQDQYLPFIGEIRAFAQNFAQQRWLPCDGRTLQIEEYQALFALIGDQFGGNPPATFALPDLRGRTILGYNGSLPNGTKIGAPTTQLNGVADLPQHSHQMMADQQEGTVLSPDGQRLGSAIDLGGTNDGSFYSTSQATTLHEDALEVSGAQSPQPFTNMQPYLALDYYICWDGVWPMRQ